MICNLTWVLSYHDCEYEIRDRNLISKEQYLTKQAAFISNTKNVKAKCLFKTS
jgi:hypothetical protein